MVFVCESKPYTLSDIFSWLVKTKKGFIGKAHGNEWFCENYDFFRFRDEKIRNFTKSFIPMCFSEKAFRSFYESTKKFLRV